MLQLLIFIAYEIHSCSFGFTEFFFPVFIFWIKHYTLCYIISRRGRIAYYYVSNIFIQMLAICRTEISNEYSRKWIKSNHTHNFWHLSQNVHTFMIFQDHGTSTHIRSLKYSSYSYLTTCMMFSFVTLNNSTYIQESQKKYCSH